jgi:Ase1/PRC1/MAP65 family protein
MLELWNLMDTPSEEQGRFQSVACNIAASEDEITEPDTLSVDSMHHVMYHTSRKNASHHIMRRQSSPELSLVVVQVEAEVLRLESLKARRMKDLVLKKHEELKQIRRRARLPEADAAVDSGKSAILPYFVLATEKMEQLL